MICNLPIELYIKIILLIEPNELDNLTDTSEQCVDMFFDFIKFIEDIMKNKPKKFIERLKIFDITQLKNLKYYIEKYGDVSYNEDVAQPIDIDLFNAQEENLQNIKKRERLLKILSKRIERLER
jgi:hypothetical protein